MAIYEKETNGDLKQTEVHLYGSSRLGIFKMDRNVEHPVISTESVFTFERGNKFFELSNHLGNVLVTISDRKLQVQNQTVTTEIAYYASDVITATDYYPFGMDMAGRNNNTEIYRYGFGGQERSIEMMLNSYTAEHWEYDSRIAKRWNVDPAIMKMPWASPYSVFNNSPLLYVDKDGKLPIWVWWIIRKLGKDVAIGILTDVAIQVTIHRYFGGDFKNFKEAWDDIHIDWWAAIGSGGANIFKNKHGAAAVNAGAALVGYWWDNWSDGNWDDAMMKAGIAGLSSYIAGGISKYISKYGSRAVSKGLSKMKVFSREVIEKMTGVKDWTQYTTDPKVGDFANIIDDHLGTGTVKEVAENFPAKAGYRNGDFDIVLNKINIGVKTGGGTGATEQAVKEMGQSYLNGKNYIFVSLDRKFKGSVEKSLRSKGIEVFKLINRDRSLNYQEIFRLMEYIKKNN